MSQLDLSIFFSYFLVVLIIFIIFLIFINFKITNFIKNKNFYFFIDENAFVYDNENNKNEIYLIKNLFNN